MDTTNDSERKPQRRGHTPSPWRGWVIWIAVAVGFALAWPYLTHHHQNKQQLSYTAFIKKVKAGNVKSITIKDQNVQGTLKKASKGESKQFTTTLPPVTQPHLLDMLEAHNVSITAKSSQPSVWIRVLIGIAPWIILIAIFWYISKKMRERMQGGGGVFGFGRSRAKRVRELSSDVKLKDVAGCENAKRDVGEIIDFLKVPERYHKLGANIPKGILLIGPPGTGKTMIARAVAGEAGAPFFSISGSEFVEMFVGVGASRVRDMFKKAKDESPSIIFIDEIDSIGRARGVWLGGGGHDEREQTLNQILSEMDGFSPRETVVVMAATNRPDVLDGALTRPGRFDRKITFELPSRHARKAILTVHAKKLPLADDVDFEGIAARAVGLSGADLANLVNEAAILAARDHKERVYMADFEMAHTRIVMGAKREEIISDEEKRIIAFHESGHTLVARLLEHADPVNKVTIIPRGLALGATQQTPEHERYNFNESYLTDKIRVMLGGRGAEKLIFREVSTGAAQDLKQATQMARRMVSQWGMSKSFGASAFDMEDNGPAFMGKQRLFSEYTARLIDEETRKLINDAERTVDSLLSEHRGNLERLARALLEHETIEDKELDELLGAEDASPVPAASILRHSRESGNPGQ